MINQGDFLEAQIDYVINQTRVSVSRDNKVSNCFYVYCELVSSDQFTSGGDYLQEYEVHWQYCQEDTTQELQDVSFDNIKAVADLYEDHREFIKNVFCTDPKPLGDVSVSYTIESENEVVEDENSNTYIKGLLIRFTIIQ